MTAAVRLLGAGIAALAGAIALAGCGATGTVDAVGADLAHGKQLFQERCASCHVLADANAAGTLGPNLDDAFRHVRNADGFGESTIRNVVRGQIAYPVEDPPTGQPGMPANLVTGEDAEAVAAYVAAVAGTGAGPTAPPGEQAPEALFVANCGGCHVLEKAGTSGTVGPALEPGTLSVEEAARQIAAGGGGMPAFEGQLTDEQIQALAEYVAQRG